MSFGAVSPFAGEWIEIASRVVRMTMAKCLTLRGWVDWNDKKVSEKEIFVDVSPFAGEWIEIENLANALAEILVSPFAGEWIEILS